MSKLREKNAKVISNVILNANSVMENGEATAGKQYREAFTKQWGIDPYDPVMLKEGFSWKKAAAKMASFREAEQSTAWNQLMRAGVNNIANNAYQMLEATYDAWVTVSGSTKDVELYAPLHSVGFPSEVAQGGLFPEVSTAGLDLSIKNKKYGSLFAVTQEAVNDDQTGQLVQKANLIGEYLKMLTEVLCMAKLLSPSGGTNYGPLFVPASETKPTYETNYPYAAASAPFVGGGYNRPATYTIFNDAGLKGGIQALGQQKDLLGNYMRVKPSHAIISPKQEFDARTILNSEWYPAGAQSAGVTGGAFSRNQLKGIIDLLVTPYMPKSTGVIDGLAYTWMLVDSSRPAFVMQMREGISVVSEAPNSGQGFDRQIQRFRAHMRGNADFIDPRFMWLGNDGSVTS